VVFAKVDTEAEQELAQSFGIMSIPTLMVFRDQVVLYSQPGALPAPSLDDLIGRVRAVDMDDVHARSPIESPSSQPDCKPCLTANHA